MFKVLIFEFEECSTSCLIGVLIAFALFVAILSSTMFSSEQVFDYDKHTPVVANTSKIE